MDPDRGNGAETETLVLAELQTLLNRGLDLDQIETQSKLLLDTRVTPDELFNE